MSSQQQPYDPPRRPLRVHVRGTTGWAGEGVPYSGFIVLIPGEPGYDLAYQRAVEALRHLGQPMPYAAPAGEDGTL